MPFSFDFGGFDPSAFGGFGGGDASQPQRPRRERKPRKAIGNAFTRTLINLGVTLLFGLGYFYFELPALNFHAEEFYVFRVPAVRGVLRVRRASPPASRGRA